MTDRWDDLLSETPSPEHEHKVMSAVAPVLEDARKRSRRRLLGWIWTAGLGTAGVGALAAVLFVRNRAAHLPAAEDTAISALDDLDLSTSDDGESLQEDLELIAADTQEIDFDLIAQLDELLDLSEADLEA